MNPPTPQPRTSVPASCRCVFSTDWDQFSQQTYEANLGKRPHGDMQTIAVADIPAHDIRCGGFLCQALSIASVSRSKLQRIADPGRAP